MSVEKLLREKGKIIVNTSAENSYGNRPNEQLKSLMGMTVAEAFQEGKDLINCWQSSNMDEEMRDALLKWESAGFRPQKMEEHPLNQKYPNIDFCGLNRMARMGKCLLYISNCGRIQWSDAITIFSIFS